jgi:tellurite resistance protein TerC
MDEFTAFLVEPFLGKPAWMWLGFLAVVATLLALDLGVLHRKQRAIGARESLVLSACYVVIGLAFGGWVWWQLGETRAIEYVTGFLVEKSLAVDNLFVIAMIFVHLGVPAAYQHRVLFWGILGVIVLRAIMIGLGAVLVAQFSWVLLIFAFFLIVTGIKMLWVTAEAPTVEETAVLRFLRRRLKVTEGLRGDRFAVREPDPATGRMALFLTPLALALIAIEIADLIFAVDSVPAIFAITTDPYIVYTSNIFAILGLRALYFALAAVIGRFRYLKHALALVLIFIGAKIIVADALGIAKVTPVISLSVTAMLLLGGVLYSLWRTRAEPTPRRPQPAVGR